MENISRREFIKKAALLTIPAVSFGAIKKNKAHIFLPEKKLKFYIKKGQRKRRKNFDYRGNTWK